MLAAALTPMGVLICQTAWAARPMITDDARVVDPKSCQIETWTRFSRDSIDYWAMPGCNVAQSIELTTGAALSWQSGSAEVTDILLQGKTLFRELEPNGWSVGLAIGYAHHSNTQARDGVTGHPYAYTPWSLSLFNDVVVLHANIGWVLENEAKRHQLTWGLGSETALTDRIWIIAEAFGTNSEKPALHAGLRGWVVQNRMQIDATCGSRIGFASDERWISVGLRLLSPPFLP
ncbi:MAG: hypothetical protein FWD57_02735 [Polyangiaceae bacterium]|nr:hypothetical protein [Polyangiaceae bacterium]